MILMYHKIDVVTPSRWWVSKARFQQQISRLVEKGCRFAYLDDYDLADPRQVVLTFDDAYENVFRHAFPFLARYTIPFEMFVIGDYVADWNDFDAREMRTRFCGLEQLKRMAASTGRMQWHTRNHSHLPKLDDAELEHQLTVNPELLAHFPHPHFKWLSYPSGKHDERSVQQASKHFAGALSVDDGSDTDRFQLNRITVDEEWMPAF